MQEQDVSRSDYFQNLLVNFIQNGPYLLVSFVPANRFKCSQPSYMYMYFFCAGVENCWHSGNLKFEVFSIQPKIPDEESTLQVKFFLVTGQLPGLQRKFLVTRIIFILIINS